jgi:tetratricopeptide (TPR) repeat protein
MAADTDDPEVWARLRRAYASITGEAERLADGPITVVIAILAAGYLGSITPQLQPIVGMLQASTQENRAQFGAVQSRLNELGPDHYVVKAHSEHAERELSLLLKQRSLAPDRVRQAFITLAQRVTDGDLCHGERSIRAKVQYWSARLHALQPETLPVARHYLEQLHQTDSGVDTRIIDALILEAEGNVDGALQVLRDIETPDGRATFMVTLFRRYGAETALSWFDDQPGRNNVSFLTGRGWSNVAVCLAKMGRWEEAVDRLAAAQEYVEKWPDLAFIEGVINAAMLLPGEWRKYALEMHLFHEAVKPIEGVEADRRRKRAKVCFEKAKDLLIKIDQHSRAQGAQAWLLWLRLTDPTPAVVHEARQEVQEGMKDGQRAVDLIPFARTFGIDFDDAPLQRYLSQRKRTGGLGGQELVAEFFLAELKMNPRERAEFLEREEERLSQIILKATLVGKRIEALVQDEQTVRARNLLEAHRDNFVDNDYERLRARIDTQAGIDPRTQLEALYRQTDSLLDLKNLVAHLKRATDWTALQPLLQELFQRERTVENALQFVDSMWHSPQIDDARVLAFLEENQYVVYHSLELASRKAWALFYLGRLKEAKTINSTLLNTRENRNDLLLETNLAIQSGDWEQFSVIISRVWATREGLDPSLLMHLASLAAEADVTASRAVDLAKLAVSKAPDNPQILMGAYVLAVQLGREKETEAEWIACAYELSSNEGPVWKVSTRTIFEEIMPRHRERRSEIEKKALLKREDSVVRSSSRV